MLDKMANKTQTEIEIETDKQITSEVVITCFDFMKQ